MQRFIEGISVYDHGDPAAIPLIFTHGFPFSSAMWEHQVAALSKRYYCVTYDVRGLGRSAAGYGQYTIESLVDDLFYIIYALRLERPIAVGLSMGGYITLRAAEKKPERFRGLVLCDTKSEADDDAGKLARAQAIKTVDLEGIDVYTSYIVPRCFSPDASAENSPVYRHAIEDVKQQNPLGVKGCLLAMACRTDTTAFLSTISVPTLIIVGEKDALTPPASMGSMREKIAGAQMAIIPGAGHMAPIENPTAVNRALESFLAEHFSYDPTLR
jgi:3-oxoadipate enol-lactonase